MTSLRFNRADRDTWIRRTEWTVALVVTVLSIALHAALLRHAGALWRDEINSVNVAAAPTLADMWRFSEFDSFPLLWTLILRGVVTFAADDGGLRVFGFATGLAMLGTLWFVDRRHARSIPLIGLALVGLNPEFIRWGDSVRAYGLGACLIVLAFLLLGEATRRPSIRSVVTASIASVSCVQCLYNNVPLLAAVIAGCVVIALRRGDARRALVPIGVGALAAVTLLPYVVIVRRAAAWSMLASGASTLPALALKIHAVIGACGSIVSAAWIAALLLALIAGAAAFARRDDADPLRDLAIYGGAALAAASVLYPLFLSALHYETQTWYYIPFVAVLVAAVEAALPAIVSGPRTRIVRIVLTIVIAAASLRPAWDSLQSRQTTIDAIAARLARAAGPKDLIVVNPWYCGITFERYYRGNAEWTTVPPLTSHRLHRFDLVKQQMLNPDAMAPVLDKMERALTAGGSVWIVGGLPRDDLPAQRIPAPPLPDSGWQAGPYTRLWGLQAWTYLKRHAGEARGVPLDVLAIEHERSGLIAVRGWHQ